MVDMIKTVGADSISALEQPMCHESQREKMDLKKADIDSRRADVESKRADLESKRRADMESAPTGYKYNRRSIRLKHYDYSRTGCYFVTICTQDRLHLFGDIVDGKMVLLEAGEMIHTLWYEIMDDFPHVYLHEFVIMPNHIHGIIEICMQNRTTLGNIIQSFKRHTTLQYIKMVKNGTLPPFNKRIWQRNYHEHIIRDDVDYERVATYTINNPTTWENDMLSKSQ